MVLFSEKNSCNEMNDTRIKKVYDDYCKMRKPECNGRIKISDFLDINNELMTIKQFDDILQHMSNSMSSDFYPGEINYKQFNEFVQSMLTFALMDKDNNRSISLKEVKSFVIFMGKYRANYAAAEEVKAFFEAHYADVDDDGKISFYEFLLVKYKAKWATSLRRPH